MHNHVGHRWIKTFLRKIISILIVYSLFFTNTANASSVGGWSMGNPIAQGASTIYEGSKNVIINGADYVKNGTAKITPTAANVAKTLGKGVAGVAVSVAVEQLLGAVDWVLDPANNQIKYKPKADPQTCSGYQDRDTMQIFCSAQAFVDSHKKNNNWYSAVVTSVNVRRQYADIYFCFKVNKSDSSCITSYGTTTVITGTDDRPEHTLPLPVVAAQVISNAENGDTSAQVSTTAAAADIVAEAETDSVKARPIAQQLESSASTKPADEAAAAEANTATGTQTQNPTKPGTSDLALEFPTFCGWAPTVCEAAQVVISFPQTLTDWWEAAKEWAKNDENEDTDNEPPEIKEIDIDALDTSTFTGTAGCPAPIVVPISFGDGGETEISYEPICQLAEKWSFVAPMIGFLSGAMIIVGVGRKGEDGEI
ncbi:MAG: putative assembly protein [Inoviridae sp.]|nr:MAG: putative assembly protein [Inoviridae sp.]